MTDKLSIVRSGGKWEAKLVLDGHESTVDLGAISKKKGWKVAANHASALTKWAMKGYVGNPPVMK